MTDQPDVVAAAAAERRPVPRTESEAADLEDRYDRMMRLAALFDDTGEELRHRSRLGTEIVADPAFANSEPLSPTTHARAEEDVLAATTGRRGLLTRSVELDADALVVRATVLTYRWIDELQEAAFQTLGSIAGRAIGYLAPEVALGGAIVSAGLIETDALDRDGVAAYLDELADANPELMEHVASGGGGLLDGLQMRSLLTAGVLAGDSGRTAAPGGLRALGVAPLPGGIGAAVRDVAGDAVADADPAATVEALEGEAPRSLAELLAEVGRATAAVVVRRVAPGRFVCLLPGPGRATGGRRLRLVGGDTTSYADEVVRAIEVAVEQNRAVGERPHVMLVGTSYGGVAAAEIAAAVGGSMTFVVDQVVTAGSPVRARATHPGDDAGAGARGPLRPRRPPRLPRQRGRRQPAHRRPRHLRGARGRGPLRRRRPGRRRGRRPRPQGRARPAAGAGLPQPLTSVERLPGRAPPRRPYVLVA